MYSTQLRKDHIHGMLLGLAVGESLGLAREGLSRRQALKHFGAELKYHGKRGVYGEQTSLAFLYAQALLNSRNEMKNLRRAFRRRLRWYPLSLPTCVSKSTLFSALKCWFAGLGIETHVKIRDNAAASRAVVAAVVMQGAGHRLVRWVEESTHLTQKNALAVDCSRAIGTLAALACKPNSGEQLVKSMLREVRGQCSESQLIEALRELEHFLDVGQSPRAVSRHFGWYGKGPRGCLAVTVMSVFCWLRFRSDFRKAVRSAVFLGGETRVTGAIVGGLCGCFQGQSAVPEEFVDRLGGAPHGRKWIAQLTDRFAHWPHGVDDLFLAPAEPSRPLRQLVRNLVQWGPNLILRLRRLSAKLC